MQDRTTLTDYARTIGFNLAQTEKDYLQHIILQAISENSGRDMVFKGGTCIQKTQNMPRYSEDIDFTAKKADTSQLLKRIQQRLNYNGYDNTYSTTNHPTGETTKYRIKGPLYTGDPFTESTVTLEISTRDETILPPKAQTINPVYNDIPPYIINAMDEREILAEKIRALLTRNKPRDIYDINYLLAKNVTPDWNLIKKKLEHYNMKPDLQTIEQKLKTMKRLWEKEMRTLTKNPPPYEQTTQNILKNLRKL